MTKVFVLDTNILLSEGKNAFYSFGTDNVVIPLVVVKELESKRSDINLGYQARSALREIAKLKSIGDIKTGVPLGQSYGTLRVETNHLSLMDLPEDIQNNPTNDIRILAVAHGLQKESKDEVILVTKDITLQIFAEISGVTAISYFGDADKENDKFIDSIPKVEVSSDFIDSLYKNGKIQHTLDVPINSGVIFVSHANSALAICRANWEFELVHNIQVGSHTGRSAEQKILLDHLTNNNIGIVSASGTAGAGKSFLMLATALELVKDSKTPYQKVVVFKPINPVGGASQDLGFLPGSLDEKIAPHTLAVYDTLKTIVPSVEVERIKRADYFEFASIAHVRGRTLSNCVVLLEEVQNLEATTILTLLSRLGINARVFMTWDIAQRDNQFIGKYDGIFKITRKLMGNKLFAHVTLKKSERSAISEMVSELLLEV